MDDRFSKPILCWMWVDLGPKFRARKDSGSLGNGGGNEGYLSFGSEESITDARLLKPGKGLLF